MRKDPLGLVAGLNSYSYATQSPLSYIDPLGLAVYRYPGNNGSKYDYYDRPQPGRENCEEPVYGVGGAIEDWVECRDCPPPVPPSPPPSLPPPPPPTVPSAGPSWPPPIWTHEGAERRLQQVIDEHKKREKEKIDCAFRALGWEAAGSTSGAIGSWASHKAFWTRLGKFGSKFIPVAGSASLGYTLYTIDGCLSYEE